MIGPPPPSRKGFRYHLIEYQPWEGGPTKPFTWNVKMSALDVVRWPPSQFPSNKRRGKVSKSTEAEVDREIAAVPEKRDSKDSSASNQEAGPGAREETEMSGCSRTCVHVPLTRVRARDNVEGGRQEGLDESDMNCCREQGGQVHRCPPIQLPPLPVTSPLQTSDKPNQEVITRQVRTDDVCDLPSEGGDEESASAEPESPASVDVHAGNNNDVITDDPREETSAQIVAVVSTSTAPNDLEAGQERQEASPGHGSSTPTEALTKRCPRRSLSPAASLELESAVHDSIEPNEQAGRGLVAPLGTGLDKEGPEQVAVSGMMEEGERARVESRVKETKKDADAAVVAVSEMEVGIELERVVGVGNR